MFLNSAFKSYNVQYVCSYVAVNACMPSHLRICPYISPCISSEFCDRVTENKTRFLLLYSPGYKSVYLSFLSAGQWESARGTGDHR